MDISRRFAIVLLSLAAVGSSDCKNTKTEKKVVREISSSARDESSFGPPIEIRLKFPKAKPIEGKPPPGTPLVMLRRRYEYDRKSGGYAMRSHPATPPTALIRRGEDQSLKLSFHEGKVTCESADSPEIASVSLAPRKPRDLSAGFQATSAKCGMIERSIASHQVALDLPSQEVGSFGEVRLDLGFYCSRKSIEPGLLLEGKTKVQLCEKAALAPAPPPPVEKKPIGWVHLDGSRVPITTALLSTVDTPHWRLVLETQALTFVFIIDGETRGITTAGATGQALESAPVSTRGRWIEPTKPYKLRVRGDPRSAKEVEIALEGSHAVQGLEFQVTGAVTAEVE